MHSGGGPALQPLLPDPFADLTSATAAPPQQLPQSPQQLRLQQAAPPRQMQQQAPAVPLQQRMRASSQPAFPERAQLLAAMGPHNSATNICTVGWDIFAQQQQQQQGVFTAGFPPQSPGFSGHLVRQSGMLPPGMLPGNAMQFGGAPLGGAQPGHQGRAHSFTGGGMGMAHDGMAAAGFGSPAAQSWLQGAAPDGWAALHSVATSMPEPVQNSVIIGGGQPRPVQSPFCLPPGVSRQSSLGGTSHAADSSGGGGADSGAGADFYSGNFAAAPPDGAWATGLGVSAARARSSSGELKGPPTLPMSAVQPFNPYSAKLRALQPGSSPSCACDAAAVGVGAYLSVPEVKLAPQWATRAELERRQRADAGGAGSSVHSPAFQPPAQSMRIGSFETAVSNASNDTHSPLGPGHPRQTSLCTATAEQLRLMS